MDDIDPSIPIPIYYQLKLLIQKQVERGELRPGDRVPTEDELCRRYHVSRTPVRQALLELAREGVLVRKKRRGTVVASTALKTTTLRAIVPDERWKWPLEEAARRWNEGQAQSPIRLDFTTVPLHRLYDALNQAVARGDAPDIAVIDSVWVAEHAYRQYLYSLDELDARWAEEIKTELFPSLLEANSYRGQQYGIPTNADATVLWYRRDWLAAEGLTPPATWDDLLAIGRHFGRDDVRSRFGLSRYPVAFVGGKAGGETTTYQLLPLLWSEGGELVDRDRIALNSPATVRFLDFLKTLVHQEQIAGPGVTQLPWHGAVDAFVRQEVALIFGGTYENYLMQSSAGWDASTFLERVGLARLPASPRGGSATLVGGMTYAIYRQSRHALDALTLLKIVLSPPVLKAFSLQTGQQPSRIAVANALLTEENRFLARTGDLFLESRNRPMLAEYAKISREFQEMVELALTTEIPLPTLISRAAERMSGITGLPIA